MCRPRSYLQICLLRLAVLALVWAGLASADPSDPGDGGGVSPNGGSSPTASAPYNP